MTTTTKSEARRTLIAVMIGIAFAGFAAIPAQAATRYYGLYRGVVADNVDPMNMGRVLIEVPDISGTKTAGWAMPVLRDPYTISSLKLPAVGQGVWIEFEQGNVAYPVWIGVIPREQ